MSISTKKKLQKAASIATTGATILWLSGISMLMPAMAATYANGTLLKATGTSSVFVVNNNLKVPVRSLSVASDSGYDLSKTKTVSASALAAVPDAMLIKTATSPDVFKLEKNFKRKLASIEIFNSYNLDWNKISTVSQPVMDSFSYAPIFQHNADLFWRDSNNVLHKFLTMVSFTGNGYNVRDLIPVNDMEYGSFAFGIDINPNVIPIPPTNGTGLSVSMASDSPGSASIPYSAFGVTYLKFNLTAGTDGAVAVTNLTIHRVGVGSATDFSNVYLYDGANRLTSGRSVNSTTNDASFASLNLTIPAGSTKTLSVVADMSGTSSTTHAGDVNAFQLASSASIGTTAAISGVFPLTGNSLTVGGSAGGSLTVATGTTPSNPSVGQANANVTSFKLTANSEDVSVRRVALYQAGTISTGNLASFQLKQGDTVLATASGLDSKGLVTFDLASSPFTIAKGNNRTFDVFANVSGQAKPNDTIAFYVDQTSDIYAVGMTYGYGVGIDIGATSGTYDGVGLTSSATNTHGTFLTVQGGQITVTTSGPTTGNVAKGANDVNFLNFSVASAANAQIKSTRIEFHSTGTDLDASNTTATAPYITDVKIVDTDTNTVITSSVDLNSFSDIGVNAGVSYAFTDVIDLTAGHTRNFKVTADLSTSISAGTLYVTLGKAAATSYVFSSTSIKNLDNNQFVTDIVPSSAIAGQQQTINAASLTLGMANDPSSQTYIKGAQNVASAGFVLTAGTGSDMKVTKIKIGGYVNDDATGANTYVIKVGANGTNITDVISSVSLWDGTTQVSTIKSFDSSTGYVTFDNFTLTVPAGTSKTLVVKANTNNSVTVSATNLLKYALDIVDASVDMTVVDGNNNSVDAAADHPNAANSSPTIAITIGSTGSLVVSQDAGTPSSALVMAGSSGVTFTQVKFSATNEDMVIDKLEVAQKTSGASDNFSSVSVEGGGQAATSMSVNSSGVADFTGLHIAVPKDGSVVVTIKASLATITGGADSGDAPVLGVTSSNFEAVGTGTSNTRLTTATGLAAIGSTTAVGNAMYVKATVPTVAKVALTGNLVAGTNTIFAFTVTNTAPVGGYDVSLKKVLFNIAINDSVVNASDLHFTNFKLYRSGETSAVTNVGFFNGTSTAAANSLGTTITGDSTGTAQANTTTTTFIMAFTNGWVAATSTGEEVISGGQSKTFFVKADATNVGTGANSVDSVAVGLATSVTSSQTARGLVFQAARVVDLTTDGSAAFVWSDNAAGVSHTSKANNSATFADWTDGYLVQTLPTDMASLTQ